MIDLSVKLTGMCCAVLGCEHAVQYMSTQQTQPAIIAPTQFVPNPNIHLFLLVSKCLTEKVSKASVSQRRCCRGLPICCSQCHVELQLHAQLCHCGLIQHEHEHEHEHEHKHKHEHRHAHEQESAHKHAQELACNHEQKHRHWSNSKYRSDSGRRQQLQHVSSSDWAALCGASRRPSQHEVMQLLWEVAC